MILKNIVYSAQFIVLNTYYNMSYFKPTKDIVFFSNDGNTLYFPQNASKELLDISYDVTEMKLDENGDMINSFLQFVSNKTLPEMYLVEEYEKMTVSVCNLFMKIGKSKSGLASRFIQLVENIDMSHKYSHLNRLVIFNRYIYEFDTYLLFDR